MSELIPFPNTMLTANTFTGIANRTGVIDRGGDVVLPGAFTDALPGFLRRGFVSLGHDWDGLPIAMPIAAEEREGGLWLTAEFHSTAEGRAARAVVRERLEKGLAVGLSVGFRTEAADCRGFKTGVELVTFTQREGIRGLDEAGIARWRAPCRLVRRVAELFEVSIVAVPMNSGSQVVDTKRVALETERWRWATHSLRIGRMG